MKLWLIAQDANKGEDVYKMAVVAAETEDIARHTHPQRRKRGGFRWLDGEWVLCNEHGMPIVYGDGLWRWAEPKDVQVVYIDETNEPSGEVVASFWAE